MQVAEEVKSPAEASNVLRRPELLAPAGDWECARAAVENGADAIYFGLDKFNARMRAHNFTEADLPGLMEFLHLRGVRGYVTFNTLVFPAELPQAGQYLRSIISAGVDAAIVQDVGIAHLIRQISPDFPIHASTQMTITSAAGVRFARRLGCNLVVLARECSLSEIRKIQEDIASDSELGHTTAMPLEVFVHGALCVAYSGQCLTSEALGGRSANRGECAQACRMPYELLSDGKEVPLGDRRYLLSPQDLAGIEVLPELVQLGVSSLKIEGRLKSAEYVASITRVYRQALDRAFQGSQPGRVYSDNDSYELQMSFSRGLYPGWFKGINNQELVHARFGKKRGVLVGRVKSISRNDVTISKEGAVKAGDGVVFDGGHPDQKEEGGRVYTVRTAGLNMVLSFGRDAVDLSRIRPGDRVWKTSDPELEKRVRQTFAEGQIHFQRRISMEVHGVPGQPLIVIARDEFGNVVQVSSTLQLQTAEKHPLTTERLREQLGRLGGTPFSLGELTSYLPPNTLLPVSELNRVRRELVSALEALRRTPKRWTLREGAPLPGAPAQPPFAQAQPELIALVRSEAQLQAVLECGIQTIYCEFEDPKRYRDAVLNVHSTSCTLPSRRVFVAPPRITKMGEEWILKQVRSSNADGYLVRNYDHLEFFHDSPCIGDFSLNVANHLTAQYYIGNFNLERLTASYDLNAEQLEALLKSSPAEWFEITLHQHMPMFHMEHCVFCSFLSTGTDYKNCGRPCDKHEVKLRDRVGAEHPLKADAGCRNTVFNAMAQTGAEFYERLVAAGARKFRIEFVNETPEQVKRALAEYRKLLRGEITGAQLWRDLRLVNQLGVTRGQLGGGRP